MIKLFLSLIFIITSTLFGSAIDKKIKKSKMVLQNSEEQKKQMSDQLSKIVANIEETRKKLNSLDEILDNLAKREQKGEKDYKAAMDSIKALDEDIDKLNKNIQDKHNKFIDILSDQFATSIAKKQIHHQSERSIMVEEYYQAYERANDKELESLKSEIDKNRRKRIFLLLKRARLKSSISSLIKQRKEYESKKREAQKLLAKLSKEEALYRQKLKDLINRQNLLRLTLAKLNILKKEEIEEARRREAQRKAELEKKAKRLAELRKIKEKQRDEAIENGGEIGSYNTAVSQEATPNVKRYGSSYQKTSVAYYRGPKTIAPFKNAKVVKKFGTYIDPIYKMKIFNDSVTLEAPKFGTKVKNILNGEVVYVGESPMLGKVVIIKNSRGIHTIYADLYKISRLVYKGSKIRKGMIIGRVRRKLIFQVTQHSKYIDPLRLIRL